ncbi:MAG: hypothetical protein EAZ97_12035 [Bacteroidetes bacterium]|nr:MAG: hypothetical protein EAZ97_12035 [Bacteroidota bacterium]
MSDFKKNKRDSIIKTVLKNKKTKENTNFEKFKVSFEYVDSSQKYASSFKDWQKDGLLSKMLELLQGYCSRPLLDQIDGEKFSKYQGFPPKEKTWFSYPPHVPEDADWARIHINGPAVIVGHIVKDTFYVVFLDKTHKFWLTKRITEN